MEKLDPERRARIRARAQEILEEEATLRDLRNARNLTQQELANVLGIKQDSVSRLERRADMLLSTMTNYVEAMGGTLRLIAEFPDRQPYVVKLENLQDDESEACIASELPLHS
jgi:transcriptional regulator with XRE-family HTH domain